MGVASQAAKRLCAGLREAGVDVTEPDLVDLAALAVPLAARFAPGPEGGPPGRPDRLLERAFDLVCGPGLLMVASPTFKGAYSGLLKVFADQVPREGLGPGVVAVPLMTAGWESHQTGPEAALRSLLAELGAPVPAPGLTVLEAEFADLDAVLGPWAARTVPVVAALLAAVPGR